ncbi:MAG: tetratricopeptide repeat protein [bacterium]
MKKTILCVAFFILISGSLCASDDPCHLAVEGSAKYDVRALQHIAECLQRENRWEEALKHIERAIEMEPNDLQSQRIKAAIDYYIREHNQAIDGPGAICP